MFQLRRQGCVNVAIPRGGLTAETVAMLRKGLEPRMAERPTYLVLDLSEASLLDSAALEMILDLQDETNLHGGDVKISAPTPLCADILSVTEIDRHIAIFPDTQTAVGSFSR